MIYRFALKFGFKIPWKIIKKNSSIRTFFIDNLSRVTLSINHNSYDLQIYIGNSVLKSTEKEQMIFFYIYFFLDTNIIYNVTVLVDSIMIHNSNDLQIIGNSVLELIFSQSVLYKNYLEVFINIKFFNIFFYGNYCLIMFASY